MGDILLRIRIDCFRALLPKIAELVTLGALFIGGVLIYMLIVQKDMGSGLLWIVIAATLIVIAIDSVLHYLAYNKYTYDFYEDRLEAQTARKSIIPFELITTVGYQRNAHDNIRGTRTIILNTAKKQFLLKYVPDDYEVYSKVVGIIERYQSGIINSDIDLKKQEAFANMFRPRTEKPPQEQDDILPPHPPSIMNTVRQNIPRPVPSTKHAVSAKKAKSQKKRVSGSKRHVKVLHKKTPAKTTKIVKKK